MDLVQGTDIFVSPRKRKRITHVAMEQSPECKLPEPVIPKKSPRRLRTPHVTPIKGRRLFVEQEPKEVKSLLPDLELLTSSNNTTTTANNNNNNNNNNKKSYPLPPCGSSLSCRTLQYFPCNELPLYHFDYDAGFVVPETRQTSRFLKLATEVGTLANGKVYVAVSDLASPHVMLGLFAGVKFEAGEVVTSYGGSLRSASTVREEDASMQTHTRSIPDSAYVRDGKRWSQQFCIGRPGEDDCTKSREPEDSLLSTAQELLAANFEIASARHKSAMVVDEVHDEKEIKPKGTPRRRLNTPARRKLADSMAMTSPTPALPPTPDLAPRTEIPSFTVRSPPPLTRPPKEWEAEMKLPGFQRTQVWPRGQDSISSSEREAFLYKIMTSGCGYMANTGRRDQFNIKVINVKPRKDGMGPNELFYVATRTIMPGEEIISPYNWKKLKL